MLEIKLNAVITDEYKQTGKIKAISIVKYLIEEVGAITDKHINNTALKDLKIHGKKIKQSYIDMLDGILYLNF